MLVGSARSILVVCLLFGGFGASAQITATGSLSGRVMDKSQAVVSGAVVKLTGVGSGLQREAKSGDEGLYNFELLPAGNYDVNVEMAGFSKVSFHAVEVSVGRQESA